MKENLKAASHWAGVISKRTAELTQKGVAAGAEKAKEVKATVDAKRARSAEGRVQATEAESGPTVQPTEAEDLVGALSAREPAAIAVEAEAVDVSEANLEPRVREQSPVVEAPRFAPEADAPSYQPADAVNELQVTDDISTGQGELAAIAAEELGPSPDAKASEAARATLHSIPRSRWPLVVAGVVAVALVGDDLLLTWERRSGATEHTAARGTGSHSSRSRAVARGGGSPVVAPAPAVLPEQAEPEPAIEKPEPDATLHVKASAPIATQPKPAQKRATAPCRG